MWCVGEENFTLLLRPLGHWFLLILEKDDPTQPQHAVDPVVAPVFANHRSFSHWYFQLQVLQSCDCTTLWLKISVTKYVVQHLSICFYWTPSMSSYAQLCLVSVLSNYSAAIVTSVDICSDDTPGCVRIKMKALCLSVSVCGTITMGNGLQEVVVMGGDISKRATEIFSLSIMQWRSGPWTSFALQLATSHAFNADSDLYLIHKGALYKFNVQSMTFDTLALTVPDFNNRALILPVPESFAICT